MDKKTRKRNPAVASKATTKYVRNNYDRIVLTMPIGRREVIKDAAAAREMSVNAYINRLITTDLNIPDEPTEDTDAQA